MNIVFEYEWRMERMLYDKSHHKIQQLHYKKGESNNQVE